MEIVLIIGAVVLFAVVVLVAVIVTPRRLASRGHNTSHSELDAESEAYRDHPPGGGTGGL